MNDEIKNYKIKNYDKFRCTADKCNFTCCEGWDISVDNETFEKWKNQGEGTAYILGNVKCENTEENERIINKKTHECCPLLDSNGLCEIVKKNGEEYLTTTCKIFPRVTNTIDGRKEFSLSAACPEVVEIISNMNLKLNMVSDDKNHELDHKVLDFPLNIREAIINIVQQDNIDMGYKLLIAYEMVGKILEHKRLTESIVIDELNKYNDTRYLKDIAEDIQYFNMNNEEAIEEVNGLFLEMIENYKDVSGLKVILQDISRFSEEANPLELLAKWKGFKTEFKNYDLLMENIIISKVIANCVNDDVVEIAIGLQLIILEYILVRYGTFLNLCVQGVQTIDINILKNIIVAFSRVIGNNSDAVIDYIYEGYESELLDLNYLTFIAIF